MGQVDNQPTESQPDPSKTLNVGPQLTSLAHNFFLNQNDLNFSVLK